MSIRAVIRSGAARRVRHVLLGVLGSSALLLPATTQALQFDFDILGGIQASLNTDFGLGAQWRLQDRDLDLIGKANLNPSVCRSSCQPQLSTPPGTIAGRMQLGLEGEGDFVNQLGLNAPGGGSLNNDDGNLNFDKYELTQTPIQINQDLEVRFADFGFVRGLTLFARYNAFHDFTNYNRDQFYPTFYTPEDRARDDDRKTDATLPTDPEAATPPGGEFGFPTPGTATFRPLSDQYNEFLGQDFDLLDAFVQARVPFPFLDGDVQITIGEQTINWGESTLLAVNSLNTINPPNVNALFRPAFLNLATVFEPVGAFRVSAPLSLNTSFEAFYQYDWEKVEIPPRGGFLSFIDVTLDGGDDNIVNPGFGQVTDDRDGNARAEQQLLTGIADTQGNVPVREIDASNEDQFGFAFTWFLPTFNNGTELRFYYAKYNSRLPYFSAIAGQESCLQAMPDGLLATASDDLNDLMADCPQQDTAQTVGAIVQHLSGERAAEQAFLQTRLESGSDGDRSPSGAGETGGQDYTCGDNPPGQGPCAEAYVLDSFQGLLEYPEGIDMFGLSFNTAFGDISVQGEIAYRPNLPLQVDDIDVAFTALQSTAPLGCAGANQSADCRPGTIDDIYAFAATLSPAGLALGDEVIPAGDLTGGGGGTAALQDLLAQAGVADLADLPVNGVQVYLSDAPGRANAFPSFLQRYRGIRPGTIQGSLPDRADTPNIDESRPGDYIQGYERFQVLQYNLGATYVIGPGNWIRSNQVILFFEVGATQVLGFPELDELQIEGPGTFYHASVGSDGSGAAVCPDGVIQGEAANPDSTRTKRALSTICGQFQPRFNSTQQQEGFATAFSWGWRIIGIVRYENVLPGISFEPLFVIGYDVDGTAPGPGENFVEGRQLYVLNVEMRWEQNWSVTTGVTVFRGAQPFNLLADRDFFQLGVRYRF